MAAAAATAAAAAAAAVFRKCVERDELPPERVGLFYGFGACKGRTVWTASKVFVEEIPWENALLGAYEAMYNDVAMKAYGDGEQAEFAAVDAFFAELERASLAGMAALRAHVERLLETTRVNFYTKFLRDNLDAIYAP